MKQSDVDFARDEARQVWLAASNSRPEAKASVFRAERIRYYPQYMQQLFDLDLNELLVCTDPAKRKWVDALGNAVPSSSAAIGGNAQCTMHNAQCIMHNAQCIMHNARCTMHNGSGKFEWLFHSFTSIAACHPFVARRS